MVNPPGTSDLGSLSVEKPEKPEQHLERLVAEHHAVLYRYAYRLTGRVADAEDLTQQTFLQAQASWHQLREASAARGWLFTILRHAWQKTCRLRSRVPLEPGETDVNNIPQEVADHPVDSEALQQSLDELPDGFKEVLLLFYFEDCSYKEIAEKTGLAIGTVMSRLSRAKDHLRKRLFGREEQLGAKFGPSEAESGVESEAGEGVGEESSGAFAQVRARLGSNVPQSQR